MDEEISIEDPEKDQEEEDHQQEEEKDHQPEEPDELLAEEEIQEPEEPLEPLPRVETPVRNLTIKLFKQSSSTEPCDILSKIFEQEQKFLETPRPILPPISPLKSPEPKVTPRPFVPQHDNNILTSVSCASKAG